MISFLFSWVERLLYKLNWTNKKQNKKCDCRGHRFLYIGHTHPKYTPKMASLGRIGIWGMYINTHHVLYFYQRKLAIDWRFNIENISRSSVFCKLLSMNGACNNFLGHYVYKNKSQFYYKKRKFIKYSWTCAKRTCYLPWLNKILYP